MLETPRIVQLTERPIAVIRLNVPRGAIREVMGPGLAELRAVVAAQGVETTGPWFSHHFRMDPDTFEFEIGLPLANGLIGQGRVSADFWPAMTVAKTVHQGPFDGLPAAWKALDAWVGEQGLTPGTDLWECYLAGPESSPAPSSWRTELNRPVVVRD